MENLDRNSGSKGKVNLMRWGWRVAFPLAATLALAAPALAQQPHTLTDLGVPFVLTDTDSHANAVNASGTVVGFSGVYNPASAMNGFVGFLNYNAIKWTPNTPNTSTGMVNYLGALQGDYCFDPPITVGGITSPGGPGTLATNAFDINSTGDAVGYSYYSLDGTCRNAVIHGVVFKNGATVPADLGVPPLPPGPLQYLISQATSINNAGKIVGYAQLNLSGNLSADAWVYDGSYHILGSLPGFTFTIPNKINSSGTIVGTSTSTAQSLGFKHTGTGPLLITENIGTLGGANSQALGINDAGMVVGTSTTGGTFAVLHAFFIDKVGLMHDLGTASVDPAAQSTANAINNSSNDIVGYSDVDPAHSWMSSQHAVIWKGSGLKGAGRIIDLNTLLPELMQPPINTTGVCPHIQCWELITATGINDVGQIVGEALVVDEGQTTGQHHAFLLSSICATQGGDSDGDGLCDNWELYGYTTPDGTFVDLPHMGANPKHKDIFIQADYMVNGGSCDGTVCSVLGHSHQLNPDATALITAAFANAPVDNPDGNTGITLHIDSGPNTVMNPLTGATWGNLSQAHSMPETTFLGRTINCPPATPGSKPVDCEYDLTDFYNIEMADLAPGRIPIFHYVLFAHQLAAYDNFGNFQGATGVTPTHPADASIVSLGGLPAYTITPTQTLVEPVGSETDQAGTLMHELGHQLGLDHGGQDGVNYKPNYLSVMNYSFQRSLLIYDGVNSLLDYSEFASIPPLNEAMLDDNVGLNGGVAIANYGTIYYCADQVKLANLANAPEKHVDIANNPIDWACDGSTTETNVQQDIAKTGGNLLMTVLTSYEDWHHLIYDGGSIGGFGVGVYPQPATLVVPESQVDSDPSAPYRVKVFSPGLAQVSPGASFNETFTISNTGLQPDTYLLSGRFTGIDWWTYDLPFEVTLAGGASQQFMVPVNIDGCSASGGQSEFKLKAASASHPTIVDSAIAVLIVAPFPAGFTAVPNVLGLSQAQATAAILSAGLVVGTVTTQNSGEPAGGVLSQSLPPCGTVAVGTAVSLVVSLGPLLYPVPNLVGLTEQAAQAALVAAGFAVGTVTPVVSSTVPEYVVISQQYPPGTMVYPGTTINFIFSEGPQPLLQVPDVRLVGFPALTAAGFTVGTLTAALSSTVGKYAVISQDPAVGALAAAGTPVNIVYSAGPQLIPVPNLVGEWQWNAMQDLAFNYDPNGLPAPLKVTITRQPSTTVPDGFVISQDPPAGTAVLMTSPVNVVVSSGGPVTAVVPTIVVGPSQTGGGIGLLAIQAAGFALGSVIYQPSPTVPFIPLDQVISQNPAGGTLAPWDTSISLVVSLGPALNVVIPNVVGLTQGAAVTAINNAPVPSNLQPDYLTYSFTTQCSATVPAGNIISQNPPAGPAALAIYGDEISAAQPFTPVNLVISAGPRAVPNYSYLGRFVGGVNNGGVGGFGKGQIGAISMAIDPVSHNLIVGDDASGLVQIFDSNGNFKSYFGGTATGQTTIAIGTWWNLFPGDRTGDGLFVGPPFAIAVDPVNLNIVAVDARGQRVLIFNSAGQFLSVFGSPGSAPGQFAFQSNNFPVGVAIDPASENIIVTDTGNNRVEIFNSAGVYLSQFGTYGSGNGQFAMPTGVAIDPVSRNIVVADLSDRVQIFNSAGVYQSQFGAPGQGDGQFVELTKVAIDPVSHYIVAADLGNGLENGNLPLGRVQIFDSTGVFLSKFGGYGLGNGQILEPGLEPILIDPVTRNILVGDGNSIEIFALTSLATTTTLGASVNPSTAGQSVTFTAAVTGNSPTGTIQFMDGGATLGAPVAMSAGLATLTLSTLSAGTHPITAVYSGDCSNATSTSPALSEVISSGPGPVSVPNVVGLTQAAATSAIQSAGLVLGTVTTASSNTVAAGNVISESPAAGTSVAPGSAVNLVVSSGPAPVSVPNVVGLTQAAASTAIQNAGLVLGTVTTASSNTVPAGNVISESPVAGTQVNPGSAVNLVFSSGPALSCVNNLNGRGTPSGTAPARIDLTWTGIPDAVSYNMYRSSVAGGPYTLIGNSILPAFTDTGGLTNGSTYYYALRPVNQSGSEVCQSNQAIITIPNVRR